MTNVRYNEGKLNTLKASVEEAESKMVIENAKLEQQKAVALQKTDGVRIESRRNKTDMKNVIDKLEKKVKQQSRSEENIDEIKEQLDTKIQAYSTTEAIVTNLTNTLNNVS